MPLTAREIIRKIEALGWRFLRQKGSHRIYIHDEVPGVIIVAYAQRRFEDWHGKGHPEKGRPAMKKSFLVVYEKGKRNYSGFAPDVAGCGSMGDTLEQMRANLREALELYMETSAEFGYELPEPTTRTVTLPIEGETDPNTTYVVEHLAITIPRTKKPRGSSTRTIKTAKRRSMQAA